MGSKDLLTEIASSSIKTDLGSLLLKRTKVASGSKSARRTAWPKIEMCAEGSHASGTCNPCIYWGAFGACAKENCDFCHLSHANPIDLGRPRRATREAIKERIFEHFLVENEDERHRLLQEEAVNHPYARKFIKGFLQNPPFEVRTVGQDLVVSL